MGEQANRVSLSRDVNKRVEEVVEVVEKVEEVVGASARPGEPPSDLGSDASTFITTPPGDHVTLPDQLFPVDPVSTVTSSVPDYSQISR